MGRGKKPNCKRCNQPKTIANCTVRSDGFFASCCKACISLNNKERHGKNKDIQNAKERARYWEKRNQDPYFILKDDMEYRQVKICIVCKEEKSIKIGKDGKCIDFYIEKDGRIASRCKKCMQNNLDKIRRENRESGKTKKRLEKMRITQPERYLLLKSKIRAKQKRIDFDIDISDIDIPNICPVLGIQLMIGGGKYNSPSLDRVNNQLGYVKGNVLVVSYRANALKRDSSIEERQKLVDFYSNIEESKKKISTMEPMGQSGEKYKWYTITDNEKRLQFRRDAYKNNIITQMLKGAKQRSKKSGLEFNISGKDIILTKKCPIFDIEFEIGLDNIETSPSLERIDSSKGYIPSNIIVICYKANRAKGDATLQELIMINDFYKNLNKNHRNNPMV